MIDVFLIIILIGVLGLLGGVFYLIYLPFKNWLVNSGRLNDKVSRRINWVFVIVPIVFGIVLYCFKDYRTPSQDTLEDIADIKLPKSFKVLRDEYQDSFKHYWIFYEIEFENNNTTDLIKNIKQSKFYNSNSFHNSAWTEKDFVQIDSIKAVWAKSPNGYDFDGQDGGVWYEIEFDTVTNILKYKEGSE